MPPSESEIAEKVQQFYEYIYQHPYLSIPEDMKKFLTEKDLVQIQLMTLIDDQTVEEEQTELYTIMEQLRETIDSHPAFSYGYINARPSVITLFTHMFLHGGWLHLIGNMLFLYMAGCNIEDVWGRPLYLGFYLTAGIRAVFTDHVLFPESDVPRIGASGAIAGLMGAFLVRFYKTKIRFLFFRWFLFIPPQASFFHAPAWLMLPFWFFEQLFYLLILKEKGGVGFSAHVGGFVIGFVAALGMLFYRIEEKYLAPKLQKKISLAQNPLFLEAMELSEQKEYARALILLEKVVRREPNHLEAYVEMQRIAEETKDAAAYTKYSAGMFDVLL